ncbi:MULTISPECIES: Fpg/Nei family DNA glycosylase [Subtercola]|uniref:Fpg/Nei family DNA glycosylase n=1 Tax=Subtercola vilae TaxID=2056433 RepID=A0A4T2BKJ7_9MICO|nr:MULTISPECIES: Fpg/Nei family DNA glycosylase [Subtercola]MEA9986635.1 Fpg/Nei family DNA glycosylase [Subtercola sp. RTI3]TIH31500.1 Fpg/Nei family DNA glycosylase [Subtercola vilae]
MPELPEVEVVRAGLEPAVTGALITGVEVFDDRSLKRHSPLAGPFADGLTGHRMLAAVRRGKFLWFPLSSGRALVTHLGMSGQVLLRVPGHPETALLRIRLSIEHPSLGEHWVNFVDQRIFGSMAVDTLVPTPDGAPAGYSGPGLAGAHLSAPAAARPSDEADPTAPVLAPTWLASIPSQVAHIARDPLDPFFDERTFFAALKSKKTGIKRALLDQTLISGVGNIYADEALWAARLHYAQPTATLSPRRARTLLAEIRLVLSKALAEGGTSFDSTYVNVNGASGYFSHSLNAYGQQGKPCPRCGHLITRESFMNRSSHFCPHCQRLRLA